MQRTRRFSLGVLLLGGLGLLGSCSEDSVTSSQDKTGPQTQVIYPASPPGTPMLVRDSVDVYVAATDNIGVERVEVWLRSEDEADPQLLSQLEQPIPPDEVPDTLRPVGGPDVYRTGWKTQLIPNATRVSLFSRAFDRAGNSTRSDLVEVKILNTQNVQPPKPAFVVEPSNSGTVETIFVFDASGTTDEFDKTADVLVHWDFNNDGTWDTDWMSAVSKVTNKFNRAGVYSVVLEAKNSLGLVSSVRLAVEVTNIGGEPRPPEPENMILIPAGTYHVGTADMTGYFEADEIPCHTVRLSADFYIERTEVTNRLYKQFLKEGILMEPPLVRAVGAVLMLYPDRVEPVEEDSLPRVILSLEESAIRVDGDSVVIKSEDLDLPVVGVSWYGAKAYAESRGLRLPTEHEWEIAAKADSVGYIYPWGRTISTDQANFRESGVGKLMPRGSYPNSKSPFGLLDLCGNAAEWVRDWYAADYYSYAPAVNPEGPILGTRRVFRGGSFLQGQEGVRVTGRAAVAPETVSGSVGFRTAYTAPVR